VASGWLEGGLRVASGSHQGGFGVATGWLPDGFRVACGWLWVALGTTKDTKDTNWRRSGGAPFRSRPTSEDGLALEMTGETFVLARPFDQFVLTCLSQQR